MKTKYSSLNFTTTFCFKLFCVIFIQNSFVRAQTETLETVTVNLSQEKFIQSVFPFDIPFYITGKIPDSCIQINFSYEITEKSRKNKKWTSFPPDSFKNKWEKLSSSDQNFLIYCPGIHPNTTYQFKFEIISKITPSKIEPLKTDLSIIILDYFTKNAQTTNYTEINNKLTDKLIEKLKTSSNSSLKDASDINKNYNADINKADWAEVFIAGWKIIETAKTDSSTLYGKESRSNVAIQAFSLAVKDFTRDIKLIEDKKITEESTKILTVPVTSILSDFKGYDLAKGIEIIKELTKTPDLLQKIIDGKAKISNGIIVEVDNIHPQSIHFITLLLNRLSSGIIIQKKDGNNPEADLFKYIRTPQDTDNTLLKLFQKVSEAVDKLEIDRRERERFIKTFPDFTKKMVISTSRNFDAITIPDVTTEKTPYISAEAGIGWAQPFEQSFYYYGANFYPVPVNKKARYWRDMSFGNALLKSISLNVGIVNFFGDRPTNTRSFLGKDSKTDIMFGLGIRVGRILKINLSTSPYKTNNDNPLSEKYTTSGAFLLSAGLDINLLKAFTDVAKALKLIP